MPRNGSGTFSLPAGNPVVSGTTISSTTHNNTLSDIATAITQSIAKDGQTVPTANLPMGGFKLTGLGAPTVAGDALRYENLYSAAGDIVGVTSLNSGPLAGLRSRFINGGMAVDQRNSGASQTFTAGAALAYCVDRWYGYCTGANVTGQRVAGSGNTQYRYQFTGAASVTKIGFSQRIEAANSYDLNNRTATVGVELANSLLTTVTWTAYYANTTDTFGTLASPTRTQISTGTITVTSTPTRYYFPVSVPSAATTGIEVEFSVGAQTSGTWTISEAQIVPGAANELWREQRPVGLELALCQRYYSRFQIGLDTTATYASHGVTYSAQMRAVPTLAIVGSATSLQALAINYDANVTPSAFGTVMQVQNSAPPGRCYYYATWSATAEL